MRTIKHPQQGDIKVIDNPIKLSGTERRTYEMAPRLGQHTDEIMGELGYSTEQISEFEAEGLVKRASQKPTM